MDASLIIPNLDGRELLATALESLRRQTVPVQTIVVDNASTDGAADMVAERFPEVQLVRNERNEGFGRAVNRGAALVDSGTVIVSNNDVVFEDVFVERIVEPFADERVGMVAGVLTQLSAPDRIDTAGVELDATLNSWDYLWDKPTALLSPTTPAPAFPCGGAAAYRVEAWKAAGGFDETIFAYWEDVDLGIRIREAGWSCALAPGARAEHHHGATSGATSPFQRRLHAFGRGYLLGKYRVLEAGPGARLKVAAVDWPTLLMHLVARRELDPIRERRRGLREGRARPRAAGPPLELTAVPLREALRRQWAWALSRFTGRRPAHFNE